LEAFGKFLGNMFPWLDEKKEESSGVDVLDV
jgi:hypothetical protein